MLLLNSTELAKVTPMETQSLFGAALQQLLVQSPIVLVSLIGVLIVFSGSVSLGKATTYARLGTIGMLLLSIAAPFVHMFMTRQVISGGGSFGMKMMAVGTVFLNVLWAGCLLLLILAIITGRASRPQPESAQ